MADVKVVQTVCSEFNTYFLLSTGEVYLCGRNDQYQCTELALGSEHDFEVADFNQKIKDIEEHKDD
jgi:alpha-tubulin suppressor-like RCC1 family protein